MNEQQNTAARRFLFISFASQDIDAAEWLADRLALLGYRPWLDRRCLRGGDDWSREISRVMSDETFRVIHLLSRHSLHDSYAAPERARACDLGRQRRETLLVPLLLEPMPRIDLPIELASTVPIDFSDWGLGLDQLDQQLHSADAPRDEDPRVGWSLPSTPVAILANRPEPLFSNAFAVEDIPAVIHHYRLRGLLDGPRWDALRRVWAFWNPSRSADLLSFHKPPTALPAGIELAHEHSVQWHFMHELADQPMSTIMPALLRRTFEQHCRARGLIHWKQTTPGRIKPRNTAWLFFPKGLVPNDKCKVENSSSKRVPIKLIGERTYKGQPFLAHLAFSQFLESIEPAANLLFLNIGVRPFEVNGEPCEPNAVGPRVKAATREWTNAHLLARLRVVVGYLADDDGIIRLGPPDQPQMWLRPLGGEIGCGLDEAELAQLGAEPASGDLESGPESDLEGS